MPRYIDAEKIVYTWLIDNDGKEHDGVTLQSVIDKMPTADVRENVRGEWIVHELGGHHNKTILWGHDCSICGHWIVVGKEKIKEYNFCPNCGADMRQTLDIHFKDALDALTKL